MERQQINCVPAQDIPLPLADLVQLLESHIQLMSSGAVPTDVYRQSCAALSQLIRHDCQALRSQVASEFLYFDHITAQARGSSPLSSTSSISSTSSVLDAADSDIPADAAASEQVFLSHMLCLMLLARYRPLTDVEEDAALRDSFTLTAPITVKYDKLDDSMLRTFWSADAQRRAVRQLLPASADKLLVFHRGVGYATADGLYLPDKLNLLLRHLARPLWAAARRTLDRAYAERLEQRMAAMANTEIDGSDKQLVLSCPPLLVERRSLVVLMPDVWQLAGKLLSVMQLREPTFKHVVVLYRNTSNSEATDDAETADPTMVTPQVQDYMPVMAGWVMDELQTSLESEDQPEEQKPGQQQQPAQDQQQQLLQQAKPQQAQQAGGAQQSGQQQPLAQQQQQVGGGQQPAQQPAAAAKERRPSSRGVRELPEVVVQQLKQSAGQARQNMTARVKSRMSRSMQLIKGAAQVEGGSVPYERRLKMAMYSSVPLADLELVLPHKQVYPQPVRLVQLAVTAATGIVSAAAATWKALSSTPPDVVHKAADATTTAAMSTMVQGVSQVIHDDLARVPAVLVGVSGILLTRSIQMYFNIRRSTLPLLQAMKLLAAKKQTGRQATVVSSVVNQIQDALTVEALICYSLLVAAQQPLTLQEVSQRGDILLSAACGQKMLLQLDTAARRLVQLGLITLIPAAPAAGGASSTSGSAASQPAAAQQTGSLSSSSSSISSMDEAVELLNSSSQVLLSAVPVEIALQILEEHWDGRTRQSFAASPTLSSTSAATKSYDSLRQQLGEEASPEVWAWVTQEAQLALADMGVMVARSSSRRGRSRAASPSAADMNAGGGLVGTPDSSSPNGAGPVSSTTVSNSGTTTTSSSSSGEVVLGGASVEPPAADTAVSDQHLTTRDSSTGSNLAVDRRGVATNAAGAGPQRWSRLLSTHVRPRAAPLLRSVPRMPSRHLHIRARMAL